MYRLSVEKANHIVKYIIRLNYFLLTRDICRPKDAIFQ